jgi:hypothetical protein
MSGIRFRHRWISAREGINGRELASGAKAPGVFCGLCGTAEAVPFQNEALSTYLCPFKIEARAHICGLSRSRLEHIIVPFPIEAERIIVPFQNRGLGTYLCPFESGLEQPLLALSK